MKRCIAFSLASGNRCSRSVGSTTRAKAFRTCNKHQWCSGVLNDQSVVDVRELMSQIKWKHVLHLLQELETLNTDGARVALEALRWTRF